MCLAVPHIVQHDYLDHAFDDQDQGDSGDSCVCEEIPLTCSSDIHIIEEEEDNSQSQSENNKTKKKNNSKTKKKKKRKMKKERRGPRGGVAVPFPERLHNMLSFVERDGHDNIVSWQPHGRCFKVHKPQEFVKDIMHYHFRQSMLTSFQRQLNLYGFRRLTSGVDRGAYYHELFLRGKPLLVKKMIRTKIKGTGIKVMINPATEPNFYAMPPISDVMEEVSGPSELEAITSSNNIVDSLDLLPSSEDMTNFNSLLDSVPDMVCCSDISEESDSDIFALDLDVETLDECPVTPRAKKSQREPVSVTPPSCYSAAPPPLFSSMCPDQKMFFEGKPFHYLDSSAFVIPLTTPPTLFVRKVSSEVHDEDDNVTVTSCDYLGNGLDDDEGNAQLATEEDPLTGLIISE